MAQFAWRRRSSLAHPSHASWPHREVHLKSQWRSSHGAAAPFWHTPHTFRGPIRSSTEGFSGRVRMRDRAHFDAPVILFVAPQGAPPKAPVAGFACMTRPFWHTPHTFRGPIGSSTQGPSGGTRIAAPPHLGAPLTRFVAPKGAPPKAPAVGFAWHHRAQFGTPLTRFVPP